MGGGGERGEDGEAEEKNVKCHENRHVGGHRGQQVFSTSQNYQFRKQIESNTPYWGSSMTMSHLHVLHYVHVLLLSETTSH